MTSLFLNRISWEMEVGTVFPLGWSFFFRSQIYFGSRKAHPAGRFLYVCRHQKVYSTFVYSKEQGKFREIEHITGIIFLYLFIIWNNYLLLFNRKYIISTTYTVKSHNTNTTSIEKVCASNQCIFPLHPLSPSQRL